MNRLLLCLLVVCVAALASACVGDEDSDLTDVAMDSDQAMDVPPDDTDGDQEVVEPEECEGQPDGMACGAATGLICLGEDCVASTCGDGYVDESRAEECDDGNQVPGDGCDPSLCVLSCTESRPCDDDGNACNGEPECNLGLNICVPGTALAEGSACTTAQDEDGTCVGQGENAICRNADCGNGTVDAASGEECDDGNAAAGDGCSPACLFECTEDRPCEDGDVCNGILECDLTTNICNEVEAPLDCDDMDACTDDLCDPVNGCANPLIDGDGDGHAPTSIGACGTDCNDMEPTVYEGNVEICDDGLDNDCNNMVDDSTMNQTWYLDCDGDGFAVMGAMTAMSCVEPAPSNGCGWTTTVPAGPSSTDCNDDRAAEKPGGTEICDGFDNDCNGATDDTSWPGQDTYEPNVGTLASLSAGLGGFGPGVTASPSSQVNFHNASDRDYYYWGPAPWFMGQFFTCRVTGMSPSMRVELHLLIEGNPIGNVLAQNSADDRSNGDVVSILMGPLPPGQAAVKYIVGVTPDSGVDSCNSTYDVECKLTNNGQW